MIKYKFSIAALALVAIHLVLLSQLSAANNEKADEPIKGHDNDTKSNPKRLLGILDWDSYMVSECNELDWCDRMITVTSTASFISN